MKVDGKPTRTIWPVEGGGAIEIIDQRHLPHAFVTVRLATAAQAARAIREMWVRGAPLIGATAAYGLALAMRADPSDVGLEAARKLLLETRPTAMNLRWALDEMAAALAPLAPSARAQAALAKAGEICDQDVAINSAIGDVGLKMLRETWQRSGPRERLNVLTHCNAGWLATVDWGTALAPIYKAFDSGLPIHVWVDETRPRNQGASLTAWELSRHGVAYTVIVDNAGGHLMQRGRVDLCIVGADRVAANGDVANKIGTYLKALAAKDTGVPFYVAVPSPTIDWTVKDGLNEIPIEERAESEITHIAGRTKQGRIESVRLAPEASPAANPAFDVTPARLVTALITERGVCAASAEGLRKLFPKPGA